MIVYRSSNLSATLSYAGNDVIGTCLQVLLSFINPSSSIITTGLIGSHDDILIMEEYRRDATGVTGVVARRWLGKDFIKRALL